MRKFTWQLQQKCYFLFEKYAAIMIFYFYLYGDTLGIDSTQRGSLLSLRL